MLDAEKRGLDRPTLRLALAVIAVAAAFLLRQTLVRHFGLELPVFFLFYPTVMLVALLCGLWPGLLATALAAALADYWIFQPVGNFRIARTSDAIVLAIFLGMGIVMSVVAERYRRYERRLAAFGREQALRETQEQLREVSEYRWLALEAANLGAWEYNLKTGELNWDECCRNGFGFRTGELVNYERAIQNIHPEDRPAVDDAVKQAIAGANGGAFHREFRVVLPVGSLHWISSHGRVYFDGEGKRRRAIRFLGVNTDITERKRAAEALGESEESLRESQRIAGLGSFALDFRTGVWTRSDVLEDLFGIDRSYDNTIAGWMALIHPDDRKEIADHLAVEVIGQGRPFSREYRIIRPVDRAVRWIHGQRRIEFDALGKPAILRGTTQDITERKQTEERLRLAASVFSHASEGIMITTPDGIILDVNDAFTQTTGYDRDEVLGRNPRFLSSGRHDRDFYAEMWGALNEKHEWSGEVWNRKKNGEICCVMQTITGALDAGGNVVQYVALFHDITLLKEHETKLEQIAYFDSLTGLPNRVLLGDRLRQAMVQGRRREQLLAVALIDLDGFKAVNDTHGHHAGDQLLTALAVRMKQVLREGDTLARLGGDEFVVVLLDLVDIGASIPIFNRLIQAVAEPMTIGESALCVTASIGVTFYPQPEDMDADQLLRQADHAMYQAKLSGRNRYQFFDFTQDQFASNRLESLNHIRHALTAGEFLLHYQPKVNMRTGEIVGAEALIRWQHPDRGLLLPAMFLPFIEDHSLAVEVGDWVIDSALAQMESWQAAGFDLPISVNVGARQLLQDHFVDHLGALLATHPLVQPSSLELEVLETSALQDVTQVAQILDDCRKLGVSIALDDFGTGYSSFTYLRSLPIDVLKIDRSFVREIMNETENLSILEAMLGLASAFRRQIVAEGVETVEHGLTLLQMGYELAQGFAIAHPMQASDLPGWAAAWRPDMRWANVPSIRNVLSSQEPA